jgi:hypothetical protein
MVASSGVKDTRASPAAGNPWVLARPLDIEIGVPVAARPMAVPRSFSICRLEKFAIYVDL